MFIDFRKIVKIVDESNNQWINASLALTTVLLLLLIIGLIVCFPDIAFVALCIIILSVIIKGIYELFKEYRRKQQYICRKCIIQITYNGKGSNSYCGYTYPGMHWRELANIQNKTQIVEAKLPNPVLHVIKNPKLWLTNYNIYKYEYN